MTYDVIPETFASFGSLLRFLRVRARLSQRELAIAVGYSEAHLSRLEQGQRRPDPDVVRAHLVPALGLAPDSPWAARLTDLARGHGPAAPEPPAGPAPPAPALLATKLYMPRPRPNLVARPAAMARLDAALGVPVTLVVAPAGFGKSTLVAAWLASLAERQDAPPLAAWLSLDADDNDLSTFVQYLVAALRGAGPAAGADTLRLLTSSPQPLPPQVLLAPLLNDAAAWERDVVLVLEDYHAIASEPVHGAVSLLIERTLPRLHLVLVTRSEPPLPLARLRARGQLLELRHADLRFTPDETAAFLRDTMGLRLSDDDAAALAARTEGWAAGLQFAALALRDAPDPLRLVRSFTGANRYVLDYLVEEVLDRQPAHLRQFLLRTSVLDRLSGELCDELLGLLLRPAAPGAPAPRDSYSQLMLDDLERQGLFLIPLDHERRWYRYHHLFAEVLRARLEQGASAESLAELHRRAAGWYARQGLLAEAIRHAIAAADWPAAARLIEQHGAAALTQGEHATMRGWLEALPPELTRARPRLALLRARIHNAAHELELAEACLADVARAAEAVGDPADAAALALEATVLGASVAVNRNDLGRAFALARQALAALPPDELRLRAEALLTLGLAHSFAGEIAPAQQAFEGAWPLADAAGDMHTALYCLANQGVIELQRGELLRAGQIFERGLALAEARSVGLMPVVGQILANYAELLCERNELALAAEMAGRAIAHSEQTGATRQLMIGLAQQAWVRVAWGDAAGAAELLDQAERLVIASKLPVSYAALVSLVRVQLWLAQGQLAAAEGWARERGLRPDGPLDSLNGLDYTAYARVLIAGGQHAQASALLDRLWEQAAAADRRWRMVTVLALRTMASHGAGDREGALAHLAAALDLAAGRGFGRTFVDEGPAMAELLREARARAIHPDYCAELLAAFPP